MFHVGGWFRIDGSSFPDGLYIILAQPYVADVVAGYAFLACVCSCEPGGNGVISVWIYERRTKC